MEKEIKEKLTMLIMQADFKAEDELTAKEFKEYFIKCFSPAVWELLK